MNYISTKLEQELFINSIISIHYFEYTTEFRYTGESHDFWELIFCDKGELCITAGNNTYVLSRGQAFLHPPAQFHNVCAHGGKSANSIIFSFESPTSELYGVSDRIIPTDVYVSSALFSVLREAKFSFQNELGMLHDSQLIRKDDNAHFASEQIIQNYIELLLIHLIRSSQNNEPFPELPQNRIKNSLISDIVAYMSANLGAKITFTHLTHKFSISSTTLKNLFSKTYGHGAMEHLTLMRIEHAKEMLRDGRYSCTDIAATCGFCSVHHFSGVFRRHEGMSPTEYVKSVKSKLELT